MVLSQHEVGEIEQGLPRAAVAYPGAGITAHEVRLPAAATVNEILNEVNKIEYTWSTCSQLLAAR